MKLKATNYLSYRNIFLTKYLCNIGYASSLQRAFPFISLLEGQAVNAK